MCLTAPSAFWQANKKRHLTMIADFLTDLRARNYSPQTLLTYGKTLQAAQVALGLMPLAEAKPAGSTAYQDGGNAARPPQATALTQGT